MPICVQIQEFFSYSPTLRDVAFFTVWLIFPEKITDRIVTKIPPTIPVIEHESFVKFFITIHPSPDPGLIHLGGLLRTLSALVLL